MIVRVGPAEYSSPETQRYACDEIEITELQEGVYALKLLGVSDFDGTALNEPHDFVIPVAGGFSIE